MVITAFDGANIQINAPNTKNGPKGIYSSSLFEI
jgi:hypothetical protein